MALIPRKGDGALPREYTHSAEQYFLDVDGKRKFITKEQYHAMSPADKQTVGYSKCKFTLNPFLDPKLWEHYSYQDVEDTFRASKALFLWQLAKFWGEQVPVNALKPCWAGTDLIEVYSKTAVVKLLRQLLRQKVEDKVIKLALQNRCVVQQGSMPLPPLFEWTGEMFTRYIHQCCGASATIEQCISSREFNDVISWCGRQMVPYDILHNQRVRDRDNVTLLQLVEVMKEKDYCKRYGVPQCLYQAPFDFRIQGQIYFDTPLTVYVEVKPTPQAS